VVARLAVEASRFDFRRGHDMIDRYGQADVEMGRNFNGCLAIRTASFRFDVVEVIIADDPKSHY
jgi:hypothetical protein